MKTLWAPVLTAAIMLLLAMPVFSRQASDHSHINAAAKSAQKGDEESISVLTDTIFTFPGYQASLPAVVTSYIKGHIVKAEVSGVTVSEGTIVDTFNSSVTTLRLPGWMRTDRKQVHAIRKTLSALEPDFIKNDNGPVTPNQAARILTELTTAKMLQPKYQVEVKDFDVVPPPRPKDFTPESIHAYNQLSATKRNEIYTALQNIGISDAVGVLNSAVNALTKGGNQ